MGELTDADHVLLEGDTVSAARSSVDRVGIVIAGMHRSGTSALVRVLSLLGVDLPTELYPARPDNPLGYWEPLQVVEAHEEFLAAIGSSFDDFFSLPDGALRNEAARTLEDRIVKILESEFADSQQFVVKDPRLCRLVPIWTAALERVGAAPRFVLPVRNPLEVAASLKLRNEYSTTRSLLLWLRHTLEAERHTRGFPRSIVSYEQLLRDWQGTVDKVAQELAVVWPRTSHAAHAEIEQFLSPRDRHHSFELSELQARADVVDWIKTTYEVLTAAAEGEQLEQDALDALRGELDRADRAFGPLFAELSLAQRSQERALSDQATELSEQAERLASMGAVAERRGRDLAERTRALAGAGAEADRLRTELARREDELTALRVEASATRELVERLEPELAEREVALEKTRSEAEASRKTAEQIELELSDRERTLGETEAEVERLNVEFARSKEERAHAAASIGRLEERVHELVNEVAAQAAETQRALSESEEIRVALAASKERLEATRAALTESRMQCGQLTHELAGRADAMAELVTMRQNILELEKRGESAEVALRDERTELAVARSQLEVASADVDRLVRALAERETALAARTEAAQHAAETISSLRTRVAELERRRINLRRRGSSQPASDSTAAVRGPWKKSSPRSRYRSTAQFTSWLRRPRSGGWEHIATYLALRRSGRFDADAYFAHYHDVRDSGINPLMHYVEHGRGEGRTGFGLESAETTATPNKPPAGAGADPAPPARAPSPPASPRPTSAPTAVTTRGAGFSDFVVLLARQRSGTNPLRWLLTAHKDITCFSEIFSVLDRDSDDRDFEDRSYRDVNFLNFAAAKEPNWSQPGVADHRELFLDFLEYLRCFSDKRYAVLDIKYNTTHLLTEPWAHDLGSPLLFDVIVEQSMKVINVTRKNHLRFVLSNQKALESGDWHVWGERPASYADRPLRLDCAGLLEELRIRAEEDAAVSRRFEGYPGYRAFEYTQLFEDDGRLSPEFRRALTDFLEIPDEWEPNQADGSHSQIFRRQASLPLSEAIENYDEVAATLSQTEYEEFLLDEPRYRAP